MIDKTTIERLKRAYRLVQGVFEKILDFLTEHSYRKPLWLSTALIVFFFIWAGFSSIDQQVRGTGRVIPSGKVRSIQHLEGGIVEEIKVQEGQTVKAGDTLFVIADKKAQADLDETNLALNSALIKQARLQAEINGDPVFKLDPALEQKFPEITKTERSIFDARSAEFTQKVDSLRDKYQQKVLTLNQLKGMIQNLSQEANVAIRQLAIKSRLRASGAISESQYLEADSTVKNFQTQINKAQTEIPITEAEMAQADNEIEETIKTHQFTLVQELSQANYDLNRQQVHIKASTDQVDRTTITSPIYGVVNKIYVTTIGGVIKPGEIIADIIPLDDTLIVEGKISTKDRGKVWLNLPVIVKITAYNYALYGGIEGKLDYISADSFTDNRNNEYYQVQVKLSRSYVAKEKPIYPGMTVDLSIQAGKISILQGILMPILQIRDNALSEVR